MSRPSRLARSLAGVPGLAGVARGVSGVFGAGQPPSSLSGLRHAFAAAPNESVLRPSIVSTIFPQLPRSSMAAFRTCLGLGVATVASLGLAKLYPVALIVGAVLLPLLAVLYFYDVNIFEQQPLTVVGGTLAWGAATGVVTALVAKRLSPSGTQVFIESTGHAVLTRGVAIPLLSAFLIILGPLYLLRFPRFGTVLDGALFGAASAVSFGGAEVIVQGLSVLQDGLRPVGAVLPWLIKLGTIAVALPVTTMAVMGAASGAVWLRYRAPRHDRRALGRLGDPRFAIPPAVGILILASIIQIVLPIGAALLVVAALAVVALLWLRLVIHVGLLEAALDIAGGPVVVCANCHHRTRLGRFCENCGISLAALPASRSGVGGVASAPPSEIRS
jgi:RsiW-degrading membrane proteinase PrsW (M82 family)